MYPFPVTVTLVQLAVGTVLVLGMWGLNLYKRPKITGAQVLKMLLKMLFVILWFIDVFKVILKVSNLIAACSNITTGCGSHIRKPFH